MAAADSAEGNTAASLKAAYDKAIVHFSCTTGETGMTGISVTLPYGDDYLYDELVDVFTACGFDNEYVSWLGSFVNASDSAVLPYTPAGYEAMPFIHRFGSR